MPLELSTSSHVSCIRLWDCLLVPLQGDVDDLQAEAAMNEVLSRLQHESCRNVLLDLSGVGTLDSHLCAVLVRLAHSARMMGAGTVVSGMRPEIAMTLEAMGVRLRGMSTVASLEEALMRLGITRGSKDDGAEQDLDDDAAFVERLLA